MKGAWAELDIRDEVVDFIVHWKQRSGLLLSRFLKGLELPKSKFYDWKKRYGKINEHNAWIPRDYWLEKWEKQAIIDFYGEHPGEGYRRVTYMMMDENIVAVSPSSVYRVLKESDTMRKWNRKPSKKGTGFKQPSGPHKHWHVDITYINICGTFYYLCGILDGYSRYMIHWDIGESMTEREVEIIIQRAREKYPDVKPRIISDNGSQFVSRDFKEFIRICGMTHVKTSPYYPQSNGKYERWNQTLKRESIRRKTPLSLEEARRVIAEFVLYYNTLRLHSAIGYISPIDKLEGRADFIHSERERKLSQARARRKERRKKQRKENLTGKGDYQNVHMIGEMEASNAGGQLARDSRSGFWQKTSEGAEFVPSNLMNNANSPHA